MAHKSLFDPYMIWSPIIIAPQQPPFHGVAQPTIYSQYQGEPGEHVWARGPLLSG